MTAITSPRVAVLLPCYNEAAAIAQTVADFRAALPEATIYVYDNNSTDATVTSRESRSRLPVMSATESIKSGKAAI